MDEISRWVKNNQALFVAICLLVPLVVVAAVIAFGIPLINFGFLLLMLICPLTHLFMMRGMNYGSQHMGHHGGAPMVQSPVGESNKEMVSGGKMAQRQLGLAPAADRSLVSEKRPSEEN